MRVRVVWLAAVSLTACAQAPVVVPRITPPVVQSPARAIKSKPPTAVGKPAQPVVPSNEQNVPTQLEDIERQLRSLRDQLAFK